MATVKIKKTSLIIIFVLTLLAVAGAYFVGNQTFNVQPKAGKNTIQTITGALVKKGYPSFSPCNQNSRISNYGLVTSGTPDRETFRGRNPSAGQKCMVLVANTTDADGLVDKRVDATGILKNNVFYATSLSLASNLERMPGVPVPKFTPAPTATPCPGLGAKANCDPDASSDSLKCCSPLVCERSAFRVLGNYTCQTPFFRTQ